MSEQNSSGAEIAETTSVPVYAHRQTKLVTLALSPTAAATFRQCRQLYKFLYIDRLGDQYSRPRPYFTMANHVHDTLRDFLKLWPPDLRTPSAVEEIFWKNWQRYRAGFRNAADEKRWAGKALAQLRAFVSNQDVTSKPLMMEEFLEAEITPGLLLRGRLDRVDQEPGGSLHIIDYKTGNVPPQIDWTQLRMHALILSHCQRLPVRRLSYLYLGPSVVESLEISASDLKATRWEVMALARKVRLERQYLPGPSPRCGGCDFNPICPRTQPIESSSAATQGQLGFWDEFPDW